MKDAGQKRYAVSPFFCPRCDKPADVLIAGVCQSCKSLLETQHGGATKKSPKYNYLEEHHIQPDARFSENGTRVQTTADNMEGENFIHSFCAELGFNFALAVEIVAFAQQRCSNEIIIQIREIADKFHFNFELSAEIVSFIDKHYKNKHNGVAEEK